MLKKLLVLFVVFGLVLLGCEGPAGPQGAQGDKGITGEKGIDGLKGPQGEDGPQGETGEAGPEGPEGPDGENGKEGDRGETGPDGDSVYIKGHLDDVSDLDDLVGGETDGFVDAWMVGGLLYIWTVDTENPDGYWKESGQIWGPKGPEGPRGDEGEPGKDEGGNAIVTVVFNSDGGTAIEGEKLLAGGKVRRPTNPVKAFSIEYIRDAVPGLYNLNATGNYTFLGWYHNDVLWDFDTPVHVDTLTLTAKWQAPSPIDISGTAGANTVVKAFTYATTASTTPFVLLLNENISMAAYTPNAGFNLTVIGVNYPGGGSTPRTIQLTGTGSLLTINPSSYLTLENVQLRGVANNTAPLVVSVASGDNIINASLTLNKGAALMNNSSTDSCYPVIQSERKFHLIMNDGSEISGNKLTLSGIFSSSVVSTKAKSVMYVYNFTMNGGTIKNNTVEFNINKTTGPSSDSSCHNFISIVTSPNFTMNGGTITQNTGTRTQGYYTYISAGTQYYGAIYPVIVAANIAGTLNGGSITDNITPHDVGLYSPTLNAFISNTPTNSYITLGGDAKIGIILYCTSNLNTSANTSYSTSSALINVNSGWRGSITQLNLTNTYGMGYMSNPAQDGHIDISIKRIMTGDGGTETTASRILAGSVSAGIVDTFNTALAKGYFIVHGLVASDATGAKPLYSSNVAIDTTQYRIARTASNRGLLEKPVLE